MGRAQLVVVVYTKVHLHSTSEYPAPPFKSDDEAVAFWDAIVGRLHMRPVLTSAGAQVDKDGRINAPVTCGTDRICTKTGLYESSMNAKYPDAKFVNANQVRLKFVQKGQPMGTFGFHLQQMSK